MRISDWSSDVCSSDLPLDGLLELLERRKGQACKVARLIDQTGRLVLKRRDLVVDLLKRPRGSQKILGVVGGVVDDPAELRVGGRGHKRDRRDGGRQQRSAQAQGARVETNGTGHGRDRKSTRLNSSH